MGKEIERKFLVRCSDWKKEVRKTTLFRQGYFPRSAMTIRVRIAEEQAFLTLKKAVSEIKRLEFEYPIPVSDAEQLLTNFCNHPLVEKKRSIIPAENGLKWEIDEFLGDNEGLILAEIELPDESTVFVHPQWLGMEVTGISRYYNSNLISHPYSQWSDQEKSGCR